MKKTASVLAFCSLLLIPFQAIAYTDVTPADPYYQSVSDFQQKGYLSDKKYFYPAALINKAEFYKIAWSVGGFKPKEKEKDLTGFADVPANSWFAPYVKKSLNTGSISMDKNDPHFHPEGHITRVEALNLIFQAQGVGTTKVFTKQDLPFTDVSVSSSYAHLAKTALEFGLFENEKKFQPYKMVTRAEAVEWMHQIQQKLEEGLNGTVQVIQLVPQINGIQGADSLLQNPKFGVLVDLWKKAHERYVYQDKVNDDDLVYGAIEGMTKELGDQYTTFQKPQKAAELTQQLSGKFDGIGVSIDLIDGMVTIVSPLKDSPAEQAGLKPNDIIQKIDDKSVDGLSLEEVANLIKGTTGTVVKLSVNRAGKTMEFNIERKHIVINSVDGSMMNGVAYIEIRSFGETTYQEFINVAKTLMAQNPKGIVIDVRNNPGGYLDSALAILDHFVPKGTRLSSLHFSSSESAQSTFDEEHRLNSERVSNVSPLEVEYKSLGDGEYSKYKIVILQNKGSASAAEILTSALKDDLNATIIGEHSFGKGSVQELTDYTDGSILKMSIAKWLTPKGINLTKNPINPDYQVDDNPNTTDDEVLTRALNFF